MPWLTKWIALLWKFIEPVAVAITSVDLTPRWPTAFEGGTIVVVIAGTLATSMWKCGLRALAPPLRYAEIATDLALVAFALILTQALLPMHDRVAHHSWLWVPQICSVALLMILNTHRAVREVSHGGSRTNVISSTVYCYASPALALVLLTLATCELVFFNLSTCTH